MKVAVIDIETTDFLDKGGSIVEIGICQLDFKTGGIEPIFDEVINENGFEEDNHVKDWIFENSDLTINDVYAAKSLEHYRIVLQLILTNYRVTSYNQKFDMAYLRDRGFIIDELFDDPMLLATDICKLPGNFGNYKWPKVTEAYKHFFPDKEYNEKHRAYQDAVDEAIILYKIKQGESK